MKTLRNIWASLTFAGWQLEWEEVAIIYVFAVSIFGILIAIFYSLIIGGIVL